MKEFAESKSQPQESSVTKRINSYNTVTGKGDVMERRNEEQKPVMSLGKKSQKQRVRFIEPSHPISSFPEKISPNG